jgi:hypothetical protein
MLRVGTSAGTGKHGWFRAIARFAQRIKQLGFEVQYQIAA